MRRGRGQCCGQAVRQLQIDLLSLTEPDDSVCGSLRRCFCVLPLLPASMGKVIIDTDPGIDDSMCIFMALRSMHVHPPRPPPATLRPASPARAQRRSPHPQTVPHLASSRPLASLDAHHNLVPSWMSL